MSNNLNQSKATVLDREQGPGYTWTKYVNGKGRPAWRLTISR